jgi:dynein heavy chain
MKVDHVIPSKLSKGKVLLFVKLQPCTLSADNIASNITVLELGPNPFEHLELLANEVFLPVLSNPQNQAKWGEVPTREIMDRFHNFLSSTTILCGQIKGETRLPMPPIDLTGGPSTAGKNRISLLEGAIITWTKQIRSVLKQDPESQLKQVMMIPHCVRILRKFTVNHVNLELGDASHSRCGDRLLEEQGE